MITRRNAFTLIELMVSISIIAVLTALASVSFGVAQRKARDARRAQDMKLLQIAAEQYSITSGGAYPAAVTAPWVSVGQTILDVLPSDPRPSNPAYVMTTAASNYCFCATMENAANGNATTSGCVFATVGNGNTGPYFCVKHRQ